MQHNFLKLWHGLRCDQKGGLRLEITTVLTVSVMAGIFCWIVFLTILQLPNVRDYADWEALQQISRLGRSDNLTSSDNVTHEISTQIDGIAHKVYLSAVNSLNDGTLDPRSKSDSP